MNEKNDDLKKSYMQFLIIVFVLCLGVLLIFLGSSFMHGGAYLDKMISGFVYKNRTDLLNRVFVIITSCGNTIPVTITTGILAVFLYIGKKRPEALFYSIQVLSVFTLNEILKFIVKRSRPDSVKLVGAVGYSFPSGHSIVSMGAALVLIYFVLKFSKNKNIAVLISMAIFLAAFLIGISRIYVGVHYPSDVVGGWMFASAYTLLGISAYENLIKKMEV